MGRERRCVLSSYAVDAAILLLKNAIKDEVMKDMTITTFMGMTPEQIQKLRIFYIEHTGKHPEDI